MNTAVYHEQLQLRLRRIFTAYSQGMDVSPGEQLRCEGFLEAGLVTGQLTRDEAEAMVAATYVSVYGEAWPFAFGERIEIPVLKMRAPVWPSAKAEE